MPTFEFWYSETATYRAYFKADDRAQAEELLRQANDGDIMFDDLPEFQDKNKGLYLEADLNSLDEI